MTRTNWCNANGNVTFPALSRTGKREREGPAAIKWGELPAKTACKRPLLTAKPKGVAAAPQPEHPPGLLPHLLFHRVIA